MARRPTPRSRHAGLSLVEVVVAVAVLGVGILALAGATNAVARLAREHRASADAALVAGSRVERERALAGAAEPCPRAPGHAGASGGRREEWSPVAGDPRLLRVVVRSPPPGARADTLVAHLPCPGEHPPAP